MLPAYKDLSFLPPSQNPHPQTLIMSFLLNSIPLYLMPW